MAYQRNILPKISIITVSFNAEKHIEQTIKSVLNQSYSNKEYIIIDGGSQDKTKQIIQQYILQIDVFVSEPDKGISDAFNKGIASASGDIIGICNADDILIDNALENIAAAYDPNCDILRFQEFIWNERTNSKKLISPTSIPCVPIQTHLLHMGCWITKSAFKKYGVYDLDFKYCMDYELIRRFLYSGARQKFVALPVGVFRLGGVSQSNNKCIEKEKIEICKRYGGTIIGGYVWILYDKFKTMLKSVVNK